MLIRGYVFDICQVECRRRCVTGMSTNPPFYTKFSTQVCCDTCSELIGYFFALKGDTIQFYFLFRSLGQDTSERISLTMSMVCCSLFSRRPKGMATPFHSEEIILLNRYSIKRKIIPLKKRPVSNIKLQYQRT